MRQFWKKMNVWYERLLLFVLTVVLLITSWCIYDSWYVYSHTLDDSILRYKPGAASAAEDELPLTEDMVAWLTVDGTSIDYPVMQYTDNIKYLNTDPFGRYSLGGSIFLDSRSSADFSDDYSLIYGHHMEYGKMFGALDSFLNEGYLRSHKSGTLIIGKNNEKVYRLTIFAALQASATEKVIFEPGQGDIRAYIRQHSDKTIIIPEGRIIALSTCAEGNDDRRTLVFCSGSVPAA